MKTPFRFLFLPFVIVAALALADTGSANAAAPIVATRSTEKPIVPYRITRGDKLAISVYGEDLNAVNKRVEARGTITLVLVGDVNVYGLTLTEAAAAIEKAYRDGRFLRNPQVTVTVEEYSPRTVTVMGKVKYPSTINLPPEEQWTIKDVIAKVGGFEDTARGTDVRLTRTMPDGTPKTYHLDVQSAILGKDKAATSTDASFIVEPSDSIYVPEKLI